MDKHTHQKFPMIGGCSLLVIFAVLCLTVFALLGFSTVQANKRLADISAQAVSDYYRADSQAEEILARLRTGEIPDGVTEKNHIYSFRCIISPTQALLVEVQEENWKILRWQTISTIQWQPDESIDLLGSNS
jgi:hypothetical protein